MANHAHGSNVGYGNGYGYGVGYGYGIGYEYLLTPGEMYETLMLSMDGPSAVQSLP